MSTQEVIENTQLQQIAALALQGIPENEISQTLKLTRYRVHKVMTSDGFKNYMQELGDRSVQDALHIFRSKMRELEPLAYEALRSNLKDKKIEAVRLFAEMVGAKERKEQSQDTAIQIIMPGSQAPGEPKDVISIPTGGSDEQQ